MPDNPIHSFFQLPGGNIADQLNLEGLRCSAVVLHRAPPIGTLAIACTNRHRRSTQATGIHPSINVAT